MYIKIALYALHEEKVRTYYLPVHNLLTLYLSPVKYITTVFPYVFSSNKLLILFLHTFA